MHEARCRICLGLLKDSDAAGYHEDCCRKLFNAPAVPQLPYSWQDLNELAKKLVLRHVTVPGVQPKLSLHLERGTRKSDRLTLVGLEGNFILKPPTVLYPEMPELEHLTMQMARACGLEVCSCGLITLEDGQWAFITRRMDRPDGHKLHMEDMCQLTDQMTDRKYSGSMERVGKTVLRHCTNALFDALRLFELTAFCFLTGNADMHLKNFSLLYEADGNIRLAPAYDLLPTALLLPQDQEETALSINGKKNRISRTDFLEFGSRIHLNDKQMTNALDRLNHSLPDMLQLAGSGFCTSEMKARYCGLIKDRAERLRLPAAS